MADTTIGPSAGVVIRTIDQTVRPADPPGIGAAIIGPRAKGPAFSPVLVKSIDADGAMFGVPDIKGKDFSAYAARTYLNLQTNPLLMVRPLGMSDTGVNPGWTESGAAAGLYAIGASGSSVVALIYSSGAVTLAGTLTSSVDTLAVNVAGWQAVTASLNRNDTNYIKKVLNTDPTQYSTYKHFVYAVYDYAPKTPATNTAFFAQQLFGSNNFQDEFITGSTTNVISQPFNSIEYNLFGIGSINAGESSNTLVKITISNIKKSVNEAQYEYGSFTLLVRDFYDNDRSPNVLETFTNLNLDPNSSNYICRRIGDKYKVWNKSTKKFDEFGQYDNQSQFIYIIPTNDLNNQNVPTTSLPWGFAGYRTVLSGGVSSKAPIPDLPFVNNLLYKGDFNTKVCWGTQIINNASGNLNFGVDDKLQHLPASFMAVSGSTGQQFSLKWISGSVQSASGFDTTVRLTDNQIAAMTTSIQMNSGSTFPSTSGSSGYTGFFTVANLENTSLAKFTLPIQNGFDGVDVRKVNPFDPANMGSTTAYETYAYRTCLDIISNSDEYPLTDLAMPGVYHANVADYALNMVENRGDTFLVMDFSGTTVSDILGQIASRNVDSPYAATFYPSLILRDRLNNKLVEVPASTVMPAVFAYNDSVAFSWFAPAGFSRGALSVHDVVRAKEKLTKNDRDRLYENRINPIATFPSSGPVVWGQKTLQVRSSARDRINVMRMLLKLQKVMTAAAIRIVFEPDLPNTWQKFVNDATKELDSIVRNFGITDYKLIFDSTTNTQAYLERNIMYGKLALVPTRAGEVVLLDFFVTNNAAQFV